MKVLMYKPGSVEEYIYGLCQGLVKQGVNLRLFCNSDFEFDKYFDIDFPLVKRILATKKGDSKIFITIKYLISMFLLLWEVIKFRPQIIHIHWFRVIPVERVFFGFLKLFGIKIVFTAHNVKPHENNEEVIKKYTKGYQFCDSVIIHSEHSRVELNSLCGVALDKIDVVGFGHYNFMADKFNYDYRDARQEIGLDEKSDVLLFFGNLRNYKGADILLNAFKKIKQDSGYADMKLVFAGGGNKKFFLLDQGMIDYINSCDDIIDELKFIDDDKVALFFSAADILILPYRDISMSAVLALSYAYSLPVIATTVGGFPEYVEDSRTGYLINPENIEQLADTIKKAFEDKKRLQEMGRNARIFAENKMDWNKIAKDTIGVYNKLL